MMRDDDPTWRAPRTINGKLLKDCSFDELRSCLETSKPPNAWTPTTFSRLLGEAARRERAAARQARSSSEAANAE